MIKSRISETENRKTIEKIKKKKLIVWKDQINKNQMNQGKEKNKTLWCQK